MTKSAKIDNTFLGDSKSDVSFSHGTRLADVAN
jgi:hypothetical protein